MCFVFGSLIYDDDSPRLCSCALGGEEREPLACVYMCVMMRLRVYIYSGPRVCVCLLHLIFSPSSPSSSSSSLYVSLRPVTNKGF